MVTIAPSIASMSSSLGMAMISLDFSATLTWPSTRRWRAAKAETMWIGGLPPFFRPDRRDGLAIDGDHPVRRSGQRRDPGDEAALELLGVERGQDVAEMIVRRRAVLERPEAAQKLELLAAEQGDIDEGLGPGQHREQAQQQDLVERVGHLALLARVLQVLEMTQKNNRLVECGTIRRRVFHGCPRPANRGVAMDSALYRFVTLLLHPIALGVAWPGGLDRKALLPYTQSSYRLEPMYDYAYGNR